MGCSEGRGLRLEGCEAPCRGAVLPDEPRPRFLPLLVHINAEGCFIRTPFENTILGVTIMNSKPLTTFHHARPWKQGLIVCSRGPELPWLCHVDHMGCFLKQNTPLQLSPSSMKLNPFLEGRHSQPRSPSPGSSRAGPEAAGTTPARTVRSKGRGELQGPRTVSGPPRLLGA